MQGSTLLHVHMHLHSLSATLLSGAGGGGGAEGETEESAERTTLLLHVLPCVCVCPLLFPLVPCKCRASASLRVLAKKGENGGEDRGTRGPPFSLRQPRAGLWGGVHVLVAGSLEGKGIEPPC